MSDEELRNAALTLLGRNSTENEEIALLKSMLAAKELCALRAGEFITGLGYIGDLTEAAGKAFLQETEKRVRRETLEWVLNNACNYQAANTVRDHIALELRRAAEDKK